MTNTIDDRSLSKPAETTGLASQITTITSVFLKWIWISIKGANNSPTKKTEKFWDMISINFDNQNQNFDEMHIKTVANAKQYLNSGNIVLDYGCATGTITCEIADTVNKIQGIDISSKMIDAAKTKAAERKIENADFAQATIFDKRYKGETFDVVLAFNILHLLEDSHKVMERINELLKPGGLIISVTPCLGEKKSFLNILLSLLTRLGIFIRLFKLSNLEDSISNVNFKIVKTENLRSPEEHYFIVAKKV